MAKRSRQEKKHKGKDKAKLSDQEKADALVITNDVVKPAFSKQQRKDVQQAIELGIERYKRQHKAKARNFDKALKNQRKQQQQQELLDTEQDTGAGDSGSGGFKRLLPWGLLFISWLGFGGYFYSQSLGA